MGDSIIPYPIVPPAIESGRKYFFTTDSGVNYEVQFGRKASSVLDATIVFGVVNEEYEGEEYVSTNRGEHYRVMATIIEVVKTYMDKNPFIRSFEFSGEHSPKEDEKQVSIRTRLFKRYINQVFGDNWDSHLTGNKVIASRRR